MSASERKIARLEMERDAALAMCDSHARMCFKACEKLLDGGIGLDPDMASFREDYAKFMTEAEEGVIVAPTLNA